MGLPRRLLETLFRARRPAQPAARSRVEHLTADQRARLRENLRQIMQPKAR